MSDLISELAWVREHMPLTRQAVARLPDLSNIRIACSMHLEMKMAPAIVGLLERGAKVALSTCNPMTVRDDFVQWCAEQGAITLAHHNMTPHEQQQAIAQALAFEPTHLCEMGAELSLAIAAAKPVGSKVRAALEATGSGTTRLAQIQPGYPVFNWDDLPIKEGLHNRHMVGLVTCHAFFERTRLTLHGKRVVVVGYGLVGRGVCDAARAYGGRVWVAERDAGRALEAQYAGFETAALEEILPSADVIICATGASQVIGAQHFSKLKHGAFLLNVGHVNAEIDIAALYKAGPHRTVRPFVEEVKLDDTRRVYVFADGAMANLVAGHGDSLNAFDVTLATMVAGLGFIVRQGEKYAPGTHLLPAAVWGTVAQDALVSARGNV